VYIVIRIKRRSKLEACAKGKYLKPLQIKTICNQYCVARALGTHRFQRAVSPEGALGSNGPSNRDCTLEAMRTQGAPPDLCTGFKTGIGY